MLYVQAHLRKPIYLQDLARAAGLDKSYFCRRYRALTGGRTHSPRTIKKNSTDIINNMLSIVIDPAAMGGTEMFEDEVETFITWVKSAKPQPGVPEVLAPGEPERARRSDREKNGVPIDTTTWQQLTDVARKVRLNDTEIPRVAA